SRLAVAGAVATQHRVLGLAPADVLPRVDHAAAQLQVHGVSAVVPDALARVVDADVAGRLHAHGQLQAHAGSLVVQVVAARVHFRAQAQRDPLLVGVVRT